MTIEARTTFLGIPIRRKELKAGEKFTFTREENWVSFLFAIPTTVAVISQDAIKVISDRSAVNEMIPPTRQSLSSIEEVIVEKDKINGAPIPNKIPGLKTTLRWAPTS